MYTTTKNTSDVFSSNIIKKFIEHQNRLNQKTLSISYGKSIVPLVALDSLRLVHEFKPENEKERLFRSTIIKNMQDSEFNCPGSSFLANISIIKALQKTSVDIEGSLRELKKLSSKTRRGNREDLINFLNQVVSDPELLSISKEVINVGGINATCDIVQTYEYYNSLEVENSSKFKVRIDPIFMASTGNKSIEKSNAFIIIADGVVDSVSEIHHLLEHFYKNQKTCFIVCRGYSRDVIKTLSENFKTKKLKVIPCSLITDLKSINSLKDISVVSGEKLVSTLAGENFSSIELEEISEVDFIKVTDSYLEIKNPSESHNVISLIEKIRKNISEENVEDKIELLENRISSINPRRVVIKLSNHEKDSFGIRKDRMKTIISLINCCCHSGFISLDLKVKNDLLREIIADMKIIGLSKFPAFAFFKSIETGLTNYRMISRTKKIITRES